MRHGEREREEGVIESVVIKERESEEGQKQEDATS